MAAWIALAVLNMLGQAVVTGCLLRYFAVKTTPWATLISVFISWYLGFFGTLFLPIDIAEGYHSTYTTFTNVTEVEVINDTTNGTARALFDGYAHLSPSAPPFSVATMVSTAASNWVASVASAANEIAYGQYVSPNGYSSSNFDASGVLLGRMLQNGSDPTGNATAGNDTVVTWEIVENEVQIRNGPLETMWFTVYWITFLMTYVVNPVVQEAVAAGEFTAKERIKTAIHVNLRYYLIVGILAAGALAYVIFGAGFDLWVLVPTLISLANTYGLVLIVLFMGYGAAEVPRMLWRKGDPQGELRRAYFQAAEVEGALFDAKTELNEVVTRIKQLQQKIVAMGNETDNQTGPGAASYRELRRCLDIVLAKCEGDVTEPNNGRSSSATNEIAAEDEKLNQRAAKRGWGKNKAMRKKLAFLHRRLMVAHAHLSKCRFRWDRHIIKAVELDYIVKRETPPAPVAKSRAGRSASMYWSPGSHERPVLDAESPTQSLSAGSQAFSALACLPNLCGGAINRALWYFKLFLGPVTWKTLAVLAEVMSLLVMWCEATIWVNLQGLASANLSVFGHLLLSAVEQGSGSYVAIQVVAAIPLAWMCICSTYAMFSIRISKYVDLSGNRNTDPYSLSINASFFNRMQFSLAFNYLNVLFHSNNKRDFPDTAFLHSVGAQMKLSVIDWYLPMLMVVVYLLCRINMFERIMRMLGIDEKGSPQKGNAEHEQTILEGAKLVASARKRLGLDAAASDRRAVQEQVDLAPLRDEDAEKGLSGLMNRVRKPGAGGKEDGKAVEMTSAHNNRPPPAPPANGGGASRFMSIDSFAGNNNAATRAQPITASKPSPDPWSSMTSSSTTSTIGKATTSIASSATTTSSKPPATTAAPPPPARITAPAAPRAETFDFPASGARQTRTSVANFTDSSNAAFSTAGGGNLAALLKGRRPAH